jgi:crotonobetainyl-CoA:carnitine CoA-transferase CaiB-like acyl-CoA transferase
MDLGPQFGVLGRSVAACPRTPVFTESPSSGNTAIRRLNPPRGSAYHRCRLAGTARGVFSANDPSEGENVGDSILDGVKVLDVASFIFGPACAATMADFGADVIKVEAPGIGDPYRYVHKSLPFPPCELDYLFQQDNRSKRGVVVNLNVASGRDVFMRLVRWADVVITNFPPRVLASLRIRYEDLVAEHPKLIYAQVTGFGEAGEHMDKPGYDATAYWARTGLMDAVRVRGGEPAMSLGGMGDHPSAMTLFSGVMLALYRRERTGKGSKVSSNLMANGAWAASAMIAGTLAGAPAFEHLDRNQPSNALINNYVTRDGRWILLAAVQQEKDFPRVLKALRLEHLADDPRFVDRAARAANAAALAKLMDAAISARDFADVCAALDSNLVTFGVMKSLMDTVDDTQMRAAGIFVPVAGIECGRGELVDSPLWLSDARKRNAYRAPKLAEHTDEVLRELGFDQKAIGGLRAERAVE